MFAIKDEFYHSYEYNSSTEYKYFPAEIYAISREVSVPDKELADSGQEITTTTPKRAVAKQVDNGTIVNKILNSLKGVAVTSSVAIVAVVGANAITPPPKVDLLNFAVNGTYIEYVLSVDELQDDLQYYIVISTTNEEDQQFLVEDEGVYTNKVDSLKEKWAYTFSFVSYDEAWGKTTYFEKAFQTADTVIEEDTPPTPIPDTPTEPEEPPPTPIPDTPTEPEEPPPLPAIPDYTISISEVTVVGLNQLRIDFADANLTEECTVELLLSYAGQTEPISRTLTTRELAQGYATLMVEDSLIPISIQPIIRYDTEQQALDCHVYECALDNSLTADVQINTYRGTIVLYLKGLTNGGTMVHVVDTNTAEVILEEELYGDYAEFFYEADTQRSYTVFLTNTNGEKTTEDFVTEIYTTVPTIPEYVFNYKNANDVGLTYNSDGTINVYIQTDFSTENEGLYYQILLGDRRFASRDALFVAEGIPNEAYSLTYQICYEYNGVQYCFNEIPVSGMVNEFYIDGQFDAELLDNTLTLSIDYYKTDILDLSSFRLVSSSGEEIQLQESDFVYDDAMGVYTLTHTFSQELEWATVYFTCTPFAQNMEGIDDYIGNLSLTESVIIYKDI